MPSLLAKVDGPWPFVIFAVVVAFQVGAALWQRLRGGVTSNEPDGPGDFPPFRQSGEPAPRTPDSHSPTFGRYAPLTDEERTARMERQLRGGVNWRGNPPPTLTPPPLYEAGREFEPAPRTENWVTLEDAAAAMRHAHERLARADALATESPPPLREAPAALHEATAHLAAADEAVTNPHTPTPRWAESTARHPNAGLAAEMARSFREPATARGAVIAAILLGRPKSLED